MALVKRLLRESIIIDAVSHAFGDSHLVPRFRKSRLGAVYWYKRKKDQKINVSY